MKVLVATRESQGVRERDLWSECLEGELVRPIEERCVGDEDCSCELAFLGLASGGLTTTATVADLPHMTVRHYAELLRGSLTRRERGFVIATRYAGELARVARSFRRSGVLERYDEWIGFRFDDDGGLRPDIAGLAGFDPADLDDLA